MSRRNQTVRPDNSEAAQEVNDSLALDTNGERVVTIKEAKDAKFYRLAIKRVPAAIKRIRHCANLANKNQYEYTQEHAAKIIDALETELRALKQAFSGAKAPVETWTL